MKMVLLGPSLALESQQNCWLSSVHKLFVTKDFNSSFKHIKVEVQKKILLSMIIKSNNAHLFVSYLIAQT